MFAAMGCLKVLQVIRGRNTLTFRSTQEVPRNRLRIVAKEKFDGPFEAINVTVVPCMLVCFMLLHERQKLLRLPAFSLVIGSRGPGIHHL